MNHSRQHTFHIPVMGLSYTIDTPIKVARFGISSVISIVEDNLIEMMRRHYYKVIGVAYNPIGIDEADYRAKRITDYLNLVNSIVEDQVSTLKKEPFTPRSDIVKYFEMLPESSTLKSLYLELESLPSAEKEKRENYLRTQILPGSIDVNIMTKVDRNIYHKDGTVVEDGSDAVAALRGYANSDLKDSSVIFSAGMNPRLHNYLESCSAFDVNEDGDFSKKVVIKVSDYRSALIQGKYLAKKGVWVSEFRIESGLNCGGHAFATEGFLLGPILEEFKTNRQQLTDSLFEIYNAAVLKKTGRTFLYSPAIKITVQGGIGTSEENSFLLQHYKAAATGWGNHFYWCPKPRL